ncbi:phage head-tail connector protein [Cellulosilyticum sp. I15G10I2]|uniref:phage head-tail connector protein n=1 Tax=Cellulosilyticum sp. I15G10I2 TaxID=1892843 RepID=UPI00085BBB2E|nr:phage head-tail connector protein [Cellulosilyticum sp. I15G10I2]
MELLEQIKLLSDNKNDALINLLITKTKKEIETITKLTYIEAMDNVLVDIVIVKLNRKGNEGINSISASGMSESYSDKYPQYINAQLDKFIKRVKLL